MLHGRYTCWDTRDTWVGEGQEGALGWGRDTGGTGGDTWVEERHMGEGQEGTLVLVEILCEVMKNLSLLRTLLGLISQFRFI